MEYSINLAYVIGFALGDGNLSRPNKRATRLRITCDSLYPNTANEMANALAALFPNNKVSRVTRKKDTCFDISVYSNLLDTYLPWKVGLGTKCAQNAHVPDWIFSEQCYIQSCLRGLIQTDGSIYVDRGYKMVNFTNNIRILADDVHRMVSSLGFKSHLYESSQRSGNPKYTVRLSRDVERFIVKIGLTKY